VTNAILRPPTLDAAGDLLRRRAVWLLIGLGLLARGVRFGLNFPLWEDEAFLAVNWIDAGFGDLLGPLAYRQVAPVGFLWTQLGMIEVFGYSEWAMRAVPFAMSVAALLLFADVARRLLGGWSGVLATGFFAVAYPGIRYAAEAKQYAGDAFFATLALWLIVRTCGGGGMRWFWPVVILTPVAMLSSYPAAFVFGGLWAWSAWRGWRSGRLGPVLVWLGVILASFAVVFWLSRAQAASELDFMQGYWGDDFPPITRPWLLPWWLLDVHAGHMLAYPIGGKNFGSTATLLLCVVGGIALWRHGYRHVLALLLLPFAVHLLAATMRQYPYGGHVKFAQHLSPAICLLAGLGLAHALSLLVEKRPRLVRPAVVVPTAILALIAVVSIVRDVSSPYKTASDERYRDFAFWFYKAGNAEGVALDSRRHLGRQFQPEAGTVLRWDASHLANVAIQGPPAGTELPPPGVPLRITTYEVEDLAFDEAGYAEFREQLERQYGPATETAWPMPRYGKRDRELQRIDRIRVLSFGTPSAGEDAP
jgi:hypothetical protein